MECLCCLFRALPKISLQGNQQNAQRFFTNVCVALHPKMFLHLSIYRMIVIREMKEYFLKHHGLLYGQLACFL